MNQLHPEGTFWGGALSLILPEPRRSCYLPSGLEVRREQLRGGDPRLVLQPRSHVSSPSPPNLTAARRLGGPPRACLTTAVRWGRPQPFSAGPEEALTRQGREWFAARKFLWTAGKMEIYFKALASFPRHQRVPKGPHSPVSRCPPPHLGPQQQVCQNNGCRFASGKVVTHSSARNSRARKPHGKVLAAPRQSNSGQAACRSGSQDGGDTTCQGRYVVLATG